MNQNEIEKKSKKKKKNWIISNKSEYLENWSIKIGLRIEQIYKLRKHKKLT